MSISIPLNKGDRVRWNINGWTGVITDLGTYQATVKWDDHPDSPLRYPSLKSLEKINMSDKLVKGDRVRYIGTTTDYIGKSGYLVGGPIGTDAVVRWDGSESNSHVLHANLIRVDKIDTTKPLEFYIVGGTNPSKPATFITMTSEGHILVGNPGKGNGFGGDSGWLMFDTTGKFVRSEASNGGGTALALRNKVDLPYEWVEQVMVPGFGYQKLRLTKRGDKLTAVKLA